MLFLHVTVIQTDQELFNILKDKRLIKVDKYYRYKITKIFHNEIGYDSMNRCRYVKSIDNSQEFKKEIFKKIDILNNNILEAFKVNTEVLNKIVDLIQKKY